MTALSLDWDDAGILFLFFCSLIFILGYSLRAKWWRYLVGRAMVILDITVTFTLLPGALRLLFHISNAHSEFFAWYTPVSCFATGLAILWRLWTVWHVNSEVSREASPTSEESNDPVRT